MACFFVVALMTIYEMRIHVRHIIPIFSVGVAGKIRKDVVEPLIRIS